MIKVDFFILFFPIDFFASVLCICCVFCLENGACEGVCTRLQQGASNFFKLCKGEMLSLCRTVLCL